MSIFIKEVDVSLIPLFKFKKFDRGAATLNIKSPDPWRYMSSKSQPITVNRDVIYKRKNVIHVPGGWVDDIEYIHGFNHGRLICIYRYQSSITLF